MAHGEGWNLRAIFGLVKYAINRVLFLIPAWYFRLPIMLGFVLWRCGKVNPVDATRVRHAREAVVKLSLIEAARDPLDRADTGQLYVVGLFGHLETILSRG